MTTNPVTSRDAHHLIKVTTKDRAARKARCSCGLTLTGISSKDAALSIYRHAQDRNFSR